MAQEQTPSWFDENAPPTAPAAVPYIPQTAATTPGTTAPAGTGGNQYTDPAFVEGKINEGFQQLYGRPANPQEMAQWKKYMLTPDTFSDGKVRVGWNPYWQDRLLHPNSGSSSVAAGDETIVPGAVGAGGGSYSGTFTGGGQYPMASVMGEGWNQPWTTPFVAPTDVTEQNDPGFQFRLKEGAQAIQRSAAAKGTLLTGGTLKDLNEWAQGQASSEYDKVYGRAKGEYDTAYGIFNTNNGNFFNRQMQVGQMGLNALSGNNQLTTSAANNKSGYDQYLADLETQVGNAKAAGDVAKTNASLSALTSAVNAGLSGYYQYKYGQPKQTSSPQIPGTPVAKDPNLGGGWG